MDTILDEIKNTYKNHNYCSLCMYRPTCYIRPKLSYEIYDLSLHLIKH